MILLNSYVFSSAATDPNFANVSLLMHMQGPNNSTTFTDSSSNAFISTAAGNAKITTAYPPKWGTACGMFDGAGDYVSVAASSQFDFGINAFTTEFWYKPNGGSGAYQYFYDIGSNGTALRLYNLNTFLAYVGGAVNINFTLGAALTIGTWYHIAFVRSGNVFTLYLNGASQGTFTDSRAAGSSSLGLRVAGTALGDFCVNGFLQDFRITKGIARYTANFTPPVAQFPDS